MAHPPRSTEIQEILQAAGLADARSLDAKLRAMGLPGIVRLETDAGSTELFDRGSFTVDELVYQIASRVLGSDDLLIFRREGDIAVQIEHEVELAWVKAQPAFAPAVEATKVDGPAAARALDALRRELGR